MIKIIGIVFITLLFIGCVTNTPVEDQINAVNEENEKLPAEAPRTVPITESPLEVDSIGMTVSRTQLLIRFNEGVTEEQRTAILDDVDAKIIGFIPRSGIYQIEIPDPGTLAGAEAIRDRLEANPRVKSVTLNFVQDLA